MSTVFPFSSAATTAVIPSRSSSPYSWLVISLCALFLLYKYILQVSPGVMTQELMQAFHLHGAGLGNLAATYFYSYLFMQLFAGPLLDKYGLRRLGSLALLLSALGALGFAYAQTLTQASAARALIGIGAAFATVSYMKAAAEWFAPRQFAFIGGLLATAVMAGALFGEAPLAWLVEQAGWRHSVAFCSVLGMAMAGLFFLGVRNNKTDGGVVQPYSPQWRDFLAILRNRKNWLLTFYSGLAFAPLATFGGLWGNAFLQATYHLSLAKAASLTSLAFIGLGIGSPLFGWWSDRCRQRYALMNAGLLLSLVAIVVVLYLHFPSLWLIGTSLFVFGCGTGAFMLGFAEGKDNNPLMLSATVVALINTGDAIFSGVTEPLTGKLLDVVSGGKVLHQVPVFSVQNYQWALTVLPFYLVLAWGFLRWVRK